MAGKSETLEDRIEQMCQARTERIRHREFDEMVEEFYAPDGLLLPSGRPALRGRDEIRAFWRGTPERGLVSLSLFSQHVEASGDLAFEVGTFSRTLRPRHGAPFQDHGKYLVIYRRQEDGGLRAVAEMFNADSRR